MSTAEGFYEAETYGLMVPISVIVVTAVIGSRALAGEEQNRTMGLLLANPIKRSRVVLEKFMGCHPLLSDQSCRLGNRLPGVAQVC